jgi:hypothetical protein
MQSLSSRDVPLPLIGGAGGDGDGTACGDDQTTFSEMLCGQVNNSCSVGTDDAVDDDVEDEEDESDAAAVTATEANRCGIKSPVNKPTFTLEQTLCL